MSGFDSISPASLFSKTWLPPPSILLQQRREIFQRMKFRLMVKADAAAIRVRNFFHEFRFKAKFAREFRVAFERDAVFFSFRR